MHFLRKAAFASSLFTLLFLALLMFEGEARADVLTITGGSITIGGEPNSRNAWRAVNFNFAGNNFSASGGTSDGQSRQGIHSNCAFGPCGPGASASPASDVTFDGAGQASFNGTISGAWWFAQDSHLVFDGPSLTLPDSSLPSLTLTSSFTMTGSILVHSLDDAAHPVIFSTGVGGRGIATLTFQYFANLGPGGYILSSVRYDFTPIPEPATLFLLGTGLAGLAARRRRRHHHRAAE